MTWGFFVGAEEEEKEERGEEEESDHPHLNTGENPSAKGVPQGLGLGTILLFGSCLTANSFISYNQKYWLKSQF